MKTLIQNALVITMQGGAEDVIRGDILIEDRLITAIGTALPSGDAEIVDASRMIVIPGLINAHMHTWQTALRGAARTGRCSNTSAGFMPALRHAFPAEDIHIATLVGALNQID